MVFFQKLIAPGIGPQLCIWASQLVPRGLIVRSMSRRLAQSACLLLLTFCLAGCKRSPSGSSNQTATAPDSRSDQFLSLMNAGKNYLDQGDATNALAIYKKAEAIIPNDADVHLNLANSCLVGGLAEEAIREADE